jgi:hypothetical protein
MDSGLLAEPVLGRRGAPIRVLGPGMTKERVPPRVKPGVAGGGEMRERHALTRLAAALLATLSRKRERENLTPP